jgi:predicted dehydrogenase
MIRFAVVGTNWITDRLIEAARLEPDFELTAVYSRTEERAKQFAEKHSIPHTFTDLEEMAKSPECDAVYLASPNSFHKDQAVLFMKHGKHVLCEKPLASNTSETMEMMEAAKANGVLLMEALKTTPLPNFQAIRENLHKIGTVRRMVSSYCQYSSRYDAYKEGTVLNAFNPEFSNGALMDIGVYCIYPAVSLFGKPDSVKAGGLKLESGVDGEGTVLLQYKDKEAVMMYSKISDSHLPTEIQGENGSILIDKIHTPEKVEIKYKDGSTEEITTLQDKPSMYYEVKEFISCLNEGKFESGINSHSVSIETASVMEEARKQIGILYPADKK